MVSLGGVMCRGKNNCGCAEETWVKTSASFRYLHLKTLNGCMLGLLVTTGSPLFHYVLC